MSHRTSDKYLAPSRVAELIDYDPITGIFRWRSRTAADFIGTKRVSSEVACAAWNGRNAGQRCMMRLARGGSLAGTIYDHGYAAHRVAWAIHYREWPRIAIDHIDGNPTNNKISNPRLASAETNARNRGLAAHNKSGFLGVNFRENTGRWKAQIGDGCRTIVLGEYATKAEAVAARLGAERVLGYHANHGKRIAWPELLRAGQAQQLVNHHDNAGAA